MSEGLSFISADAFVIFIRGIPDDGAMLSLHLTSCSLFAIPVDRHLNRDQERTREQADWGGVALDLEGKCAQNATIAFAWSLLSGVTSEQFRGGWSERLDRSKIGRWLEVGGIEFGFWRLDLWVLVRQLCWHCFCYCCCCRLSKLLLRITEEILTRMHWSFYFTGEATPNIHLHDTGFIWSQAPLTTFDWGNATSMWTFCLGCFERRDLDSDKSAGEE